MRESLLKRAATGDEKWAAHAERLKAIEHLHAHGQATIRMLFFLNSGSIVALLTFIGSLFSKGDQQSQTAATVLGIAFLHSFYWYGIALAFTDAASGLAYINWAAASELEDDPGDIYRFTLLMPRCAGAPERCGSAGDDDRSIAGQFG